MKLEPELLLRAWGLWVGGGSYSGGNVNILYRCEREGSGAAHSTVPGLPHMPYTIELVERFVCQLKRDRAHIYRAVMHYFVGRESSEMAAKKLRVSTDIFESRIAQAVVSLDDYLAEY